MNLLTAGAGITVLSQRALLYVYKGESEPSGLTSAVRKYMKSIFWGCFHLPSLKLSSHKYSRRALPCSFLLEKISTLTY